MTPEQRTLAEQNVKLVYHALKRYHHYDMDALVSAGMMGLMKAALTFDPTKGFRFSSYAIPCIRTEIHNELRSANRHPTLSLDAPQNDPDDPDTITLSNLLGAGDQTELIADNRVEVELLHEAIGALPPRERYVICAYYGISCHPMLQSDIGNRLGISRAGVSYIHGQAIKHLRAYMMREGNNAKPKNKPPLEL